MLISLPHLHYGVNTSGSQCLIWNSCCQFASLEFSTFKSPLASLGLSLLIRRLHSSNTHRLSSLLSGIHWNTQILSGFGLSIYSDAFSNLNGFYLRYSQLSFFQLLLNASSGAGQIPGISWASLGGTLGNFLQLSLTPFHSAAVFIPMSSVPGWSLGILCEALGLPDLHPQNPSLLRCPNRIWRLQHYQPSSCSDTQGSSNTVCLLLHPSLLPFPAQTSSSLGVVGRKNWFWLKVLIIPDLFVLCLDISVFETPKPRIWIFCSPLQNINPALRQWILKVFE